MKGYKKGWSEWVAYLRSREVIDPYLNRVSEEEKVSLLCNFFRTRHEVGKRGKEAHSAGAAVRKYFEMTLVSTAFMDHPIVTAARTACRRTTDELRAFARCGKSKDKLPIWWALLVDIRDTLWVGKKWTYPEIDDRMTAIAALIAYDLANRGGEATTVGGLDKENHTLYNEQVVFRLRNSVSVNGRETFAFHAGSSQFREHVRASNVKSCEVGGATHKVGALHTLKVIARRTPRESNTLDDLLEWCLKSGSMSQEPLFSRRTLIKGKQSHKKLQSKMLTQAIKGAALRLNMDPSEFASHSIRKGAVTQMNAFGCAIEETNSRGNYSKSSKMVQTVYNHDSTGRGPLAASSSSVGRDITRDDIAKHLKVTRYL